MWGLHLRDENLGTPPFLRRLGNDLDKLISLAKPPESLALPEGVRAAVTDWIARWRKDVIEFTTFERICGRGRYYEFRQHVQDYTAWLHAGIDSGHATH